MANNLKVPEGIESIMRKPPPIPSLPNNINNNAQYSMFHPSSSGNLGGLEIPKIPEVNIPESLGPPASSFPFEQPIATPLSQFNVAGNIQHIAGATQQELEEVQKAAKMASVNDGGDLAEAVGIYRKENGFNPKMEATFLSRWEVTQKIKALCSISQYQKKGVQVQSLTVDHSLQLINIELERIRRSIDVEASCISYKNMLMGLVTCIELFNSFSRRKLNFDGWSEHFRLNDLQKCDVLIYRICDEQKVLASPKFLLLQVVVGSAFFFHISQGIGEEMGKVIGKPMTQIIMEKLKKNPAKFVQFLSGGGFGDDKKNPKIIPAKVKRVNTDHAVPPPRSSTAPPYDSGALPPLKPSTFQQRAAPPVEAPIDLEVASIIDSETSTSTGIKRRGRPKKRKTISVSI